jgi:predicted GIY-YIG superfamily endonuclease
VWQHQRGEIEGSTKAYNVDRLVYYECFDDPRDAIARENEIKGWRREKKNALVETENPKWAGLSPTLFQHFKPSSRGSAAKGRGVMVKGNSSILRVLRGPSLRSG